MSRYKYQLSIIIAILVMIAPCALFAAAGQKKVIELGGGKDHVYINQILNPEFVKMMQSRPFDGFPLRLGNSRGQFSRAFDTNLWPEDGIPFDKLQEINWGHYTDNFILLYGTNYEKMNWFNDKQWKTIEANMKLVSWAMVASHSVGVMFDPEPYGRNPWAYKKKWYPHKSFEEVAAKVRQRGSEFIKALQSHKPDMKLLSLHMWWAFRLEVLKATSAKRLWPIPKKVRDTHTDTSPYVSSLQYSKHYQVDNKKLVDVLKKSHYGLYLPFLKGMLDGANPKVMFIDGSEATYYYPNPVNYQRIGQVLRQNAHVLTDSKNLKKLETQLSYAVALYINEAFGWRKKRTLGSYLTHQQQLKLFTYQVEFAMKYADKYVWVYSDGMNWWEKNKKLPKGVGKAIKRGISQYKSGKPLDRKGLSKLLKQAQKEKAKAQQSTD